MFDPDFNMTRCALLGMAKREINYNTHVIDRLYSDVAHHTYHLFSDKFVDGLKVGQGVKTLEPDDAFTWCLTYLDKPQFDKAEVYLYK